MAKEKTRTVMCRIGTRCCWERFPCGRFCPKKGFSCFKFILSLHGCVVLCNAKDYDTMYTITDDTKCTFLSEYNVMLEVHHTTMAHKKIGPKKAFLV